MDELNNGEQGQYVEPGKNEKKNNTRKIVKRTLLTAGLALAVYMVYSIVYLFISPDRNIQSGALFAAKSCWLGGKGIRRSGLRYVDERVFGKIRHNRHRNFDKVYRG